MISAGEKTPHHHEDGLGAGILNNYIVLPRFVFWSQSRHLEPSWLRTKGGFPVKRIIILLLLIAMLIPASSLAAGKLTVTQEAFYVRPFTSYHAGEIYAELTNTGDKPIAFNGGLIELYDAEGNSIESSNIYSCYPPILGPGEVGYLYDTTYVKEAVDKSFIDDYSLTVTSKGENEKTLHHYPSEGTYGEVQRSKYSTEFRISAAITNDSGADQDDISVAIALYDKDDKLIYADRVNPNNITVPAGQSIIFRTSVDRRILEAWAEEGIEPAKIVTIAYSED